MVAPGRRAAAGPGCGRAGGKGHPAARARPGFAGGHPARHVRPVGRPCGRGEIWHAPPTITTEGAAMAKGLDKKKEDKPAKEQPKKKEKDDDDDMVRKEGNTVG